MSDSGSLFSSMIICCCSLWCCWILCNHTEGASFFFFVHPWRYIKRWTEENMNVFQHSHICGYLCTHCGYDGWKKIGEGHWRQTMTIMPEKMRRAATTLTGAYGAIVTSLPGKQQFAPWKIFRPICNRNCWNKTLRENCLRIFVANLFIIHSLPLFPTPPLHVALYTNWSTIWHVVQRMSQPAHQLWARLASGEE